MSFTAPTHVPFGWNDEPSKSTPLDSVNLESAEEDLVSYTQTVIEAYDAYAQNQFAPSGGVTEIVYGGASSTTVFDTTVFGGTASTTAFNTTLYGGTASTSSSNTLDAWTSGTAYTTGQQVAYQGQLYYAQTTFRSGLSFVLDGANWGQVPPLGRLAQSSSYTLLPTDPWYIAITSTASAWTVTLPLASGSAPGKTFVIVDESNAAGTNNITVTRAGADTIISGTTTTTAVISSNGGNRKLYSDGVSKWFTI